MDVNEETLNPFHDFKKRVVLSQFLIKRKNVCYLKNEQFSQHFL